MFTVKFGTDNSAFNDDSADFGNDEVARILGEIAEKVQDNRYGVECDIPIYDSNGNRVGSWRYDR